MSAALSANTVWRSAGIQTATPRSRSPCRETSRATIRHSPICVTTPLCSGEPELFRTLASMRWASASFTYGSANAVIATAATVSAAANDTTGATRRSGAMPLAWIARISRSAASRPSAITAPSSTEYGVARPTIGSAESSAISVTSLAPKPRFTTRSV